MEVYLQSLGFNVWQSVENGDDVPKTTLVDTTNRRQYEYNARDINLTLCEHIIQPDKNFILTTRTLGVQIHFLCIKHQNQLSNSKVMLLVAFFCI